MNVLGKMQKNRNLFSVLMGKEVTNIDKDGHESVVTISCHQHGHERVVTKCCH